MPTSEPTTVAFNLPVSEAETDEEYAAKQLEIMRRLDSSELTYETMSPEEAWYLPTALLVSLHKGKPLEPPSVYWYGVPLPEEAIRLIHAEALKETKSLAVARKWLEHLRGSPRPKALLILAGGTGIGKTVAAAWLLRKFGQGGRYIKARELVQKHGSGWSETVAEYKDLIRSDLLVVDEVGGEHDQEKAKASLHDTIDERQAKPTLVISNLGWTDLQKRLDARTADRIREVGAVRWIDGESMR